MPEQWNDKRERQYEEIRKSARDRGESADRAKEIAARTVNKERAQAGESRQASRTSVDDVSPGHRGGKRSGHGSGGPTRDQLYNEARQRGIKGRSKMTKRQLQNALGH
ncbi:MAG TPA: plasmid stabilization protein [Nocardioidaceae bacterium]|nr:plasmid stabilization protein [Nocardioidaceae bacterium]